MIKVSALAAKVREIGLENPDTIYGDIEVDLRGHNVEVCEYQINGTPACIVGRALSELGVDIETLEGFDNVHGTGSETIDAVIRSCPEIFECDSPDAFYYIRDVQARQDGGSAWGEAIAQ